MKIKIRCETPVDYEVITSVNDLAFGQNQEGFLVASLRKRTGFVPELSLVATSGKKVVGHILFFPVNIVSLEKTQSTLSLGPMSVLPDYQNKGVGGALVTNGLKKAKDIGYTSVVVLGHPGYYPKFGFSRASQWNIKTPFEAPDEAMMAIELVQGSLESEGGMIEYPPEFYDAV